MSDRSPATEPEPAARRFRRLPRVDVAGRTVPVARGPIARLLGLALLPPERAPEGLLIPRCRSVHTFGMRFPVHVVFCDRDLVPVAIRDAVPANRIVSDRRAAAVLELPAGVPAEEPGRRRARRAPHALPGVPEGGRGRA